MPHVDPDRLVLLAVGDMVADVLESDHLDRCAACRADLDAMLVVAEHGRQTQQLSELPSPPERVWHRIAAATLPLPRLDPGADIAALPGRSPTLGLPSTRMRRWIRDAAIAVAAAGIAVLGTLALMRVANRPSDPPIDQIAAIAQLATLPGAPSGAQGMARVLHDGAGQRLHLHVTGLPRRPGYYEVWLINPDTFDMVSVGTLRDGGDELLPLPSTIDLRRYRLIDVSAEEYDGNAEHSGRSMLRGSLAG